MLEAFEKELRLLEEIPLPRLVWICKTLGRKLPHPYYLVLSPWVRNRLLSFYTFQRTEVKNVLRFSGQESKIKIKKWIRIATVEIRHITRHVRSQTRRE